jgi:hypothetical protein
MRVWIYSDKIILVFTIKCHRFLQYICTGSCLSAFTFYSHTVGNVS